MKLLAQVGWNLLFATVVASGALAQQRHVQASLGWSRNPISNGALDQRIKDAATQYHAYAPIPRVAFYDIAYPSDSLEAASLNGYAVMVVTAVVQDSGELPLPRLYFRSASGDQQLSVYSRIGSRVVDTVIGATFGMFRVDALYLLPLAVRLQVGDLLVDFAAHRQAFALGHFDGDIPEQFQSLGPIEAPAHLPPDAAIAAIVRREYPDLAPAILPTP
jgi:hypothetical protein